MYIREQYQTIFDRLHEERHFIQIIMGPRQVGKTTLVKQVLADLDIPWFMFSADDVPASNRGWVSECWESARTRMRMENLKELVLAIDEIQLIEQWSSVVKKEWDADTFNDVNIKVLLLGSSRVLLEKGLSESLAGRFEIIRMTHWSYGEMRDVFGFSLEQYIYFGGYPGGAPFVNDEDRWEDYIKSSIIDATINKDILYNTPISKPALLRQTFELSAAYSGEILSLTKMLGSLQDAGNTVTLSGYLQLLDESGMVVPLQKYAKDYARRKASVPKFQVYNNALKSVYSNTTFHRVMQDRTLWGRLFESAIGSYIVCQAYIHRFDVYYWRENNCEVDYVISKNGRTVAIEVKSNSATYNKGLSVFCEHLKPHLFFVVGEGGVKTEDFLKWELIKLFE